MKVQLQIDDSLLQEALALGECDNQQILIEEALKEYIQYRKQSKILDIGSIECNDDQDISFVQRDFNKKTIEAIEELKSKKTLNTYNNFAEIRHDLGV